MATSVLTSRSSAARLAALALSVVTLAGCQSINMNSPQLRVIDASPDAGVLDSYQNNTALAYNLVFGTVTNYVPMVPGAYTLAADHAGTRQTLVSSNATLAPSKQYTAIVGNFAAQGEIALRFVQQATRSGAVDVYLVPRSGRLANTSPIAVNLGFGAVSNYLTVPAGTYAIDIVPTGTTLVSSTVTLLTGPQVEYASGAVRTVVLIDQEIIGQQHAALTPGVQTIIAADADAL